MTDWVRLWHDMPTDPKWRTIARKSKQRVGDVIAVFNFLMVNASGNAAERGKVVGFDCEDVATALDLDETDVVAILDAMRGKVLDANDCLTGWEKRQPKREDSTAAVRKAAWAERKKNAPERAGTQGNAPETDAETETDTSVSNDTGTDGADPSKIMFDAGIGLITKSGKSQSAARSWLAKARKDHGTEAVITVIGAAKREGAIEPISFMEASLRTRARTAEPAFSGPC